MSRSARSLVMLLVVFAAALEPLRAAEALYWDQSDTSGVTASLWGVAAAADHMIAVGEGGTILRTNPYGWTWTPRAGETDNWLLGVAHGNGRWVVVGDKGTLLTSDDKGDIWIPRTSGTTARLNAVAYGAGRWVAVGEGGTVVTSADAVSWSVVTLPNTGFLRGLAFGQGRFLIGGQAGKLFVSVDGQTFAAQAFPQAADIEAIAISDQQYVVAGGGGLVAVSTDLSTWQVLSGMDGSETFRGVALGGDGALIAAGQRTAVVGSKPVDGPGYLVTAVARTGGYGEFAAVGLGGGISIVRASAGVTLEAEGAGERLGSLDSLAPIFGSKLTLSARLSGLAGPVSYQWKKDDQPIPGATQATLVVGPVTLADDGPYEVQVTVGGKTYSDYRSIFAVPGGRLELAVQTRQYESDGEPVYLDVRGDGKRLVLEYRESARALRLVDTDGNVDPTFNSAIQLTAGDHVQGVRVDAANRVYVLISGRKVVRLLPDGALDPMFSASSDLLGVKWLHFSPSGDLYIQMDGRIQRMLENGSLDTTFFIAASQIIDFGDDGRLYLAAMVDGSSSAIRVIRVDPLGVIDPTYVSETFTVGPQASLYFHYVHKNRVFGRFSLTYSGSGTSHRLIMLDENGTTIDLPGAYASAEYGAPDLVLGREGQYWKHSSGSVAVYNSDGSLDRTQYSAPPVVQGYLRLAYAGRDWLGFETSNGAMETQILRGTPGRLTNLSVRAAATREAPLIAGFYIAGSKPVQTLVRGVGPALAGFGVSSVMPNPALRLVRDNQTVSENLDWSSGLAQRFASAGAFPLSEGSPDAALEVTLQSGAYTAVLTPEAGTSSGTVLAEIYEMDGGASDETRYVNISARGPVAPGSPLIVGFAITGEVPATVLIRGIGPTLANFGVSGVLANPRLTLFRGQTALWENFDWATQNPTQTDSRHGTGAFELAAESQDASMVVTLAPGAYTAVLEAEPGSGSTGTALIEVYETVP